MTEYYDECRSNLEALLHWYQNQVSDRNEATTRLQLVDRLLFECLGWPRDDATLEQPYGGEYADYTLYAPRAVLIVEAKREGDYFELPAGKTRLEQGLPSLLRDNPNLKSAVEQAARYCQQRGVPIGAVSNGHQIVAFVATRSDGLPPLEGRALVFPSLQLMLDKFQDLWQALSRSGIEERLILKRLIGDLPDQPPTKLSAAIQGYPGTKIRNEFQSDLKIVSDLVLEDVTRLPELEDVFLENCYTQSGTLSQYALISEKILEARYATLFDGDNLAPTTVPINKQTTARTDLLAEGITRRPILLIGDVGVGKTMFIRKLIKMDLARILEKAVTIYIDLGSQATMSDDLSTFIPLEVEQQIKIGFGIDIQERDFVRKVYEAELEGFATGIYSDLREIDPSQYKIREIEFLAEKVRNRAEHLRLALPSITKQHRKQIVLFIDNADQRNEDIQQVAFLIAQEFAQHYPAMVFMALRPETFHRSRRTGALSGYHPKAFTISPPRIEEVVRKRLDFALRLTTGQIPIQSLRQVGIRFSSLAKLIQILLDGFHRHASIPEFVVNMSGGNVRLALDLVREFFGSGHIDTQKIINIYDWTARYVIPLHEFVNAIIFGDSKYYDPATSPIANLFDVATNDPKEHFLLPLLIDAVYSLGKMGSNYGFVETEAVYTRLQGFGFVPDQIDAAIVRAWRYRLIESVARFTPISGEAMPRGLRATTPGMYHVEKLCQQFSYVDAILVDTPIFDPMVRSAITIAEDIPDPESRLEARLKRTRTFREYLDNIWTTNNFDGALWRWPAKSQTLQWWLSRIRPNSIVAKRNNETVL
jgi:GTPase SAR1 family protein